MRQPNIIFLLKRERAEYGRQEKERGKELRESKGGRETELGLASTPPPCPAMTPITLDGGAGG